MAFLDISTGEFFVAEGNQNTSTSCCKPCSPPKWYFNASIKNNSKKLSGRNFIPIRSRAGYSTKPIRTGCLLKHFQTHSLKGFGIEDMSAGIVAAGAVLQYLKDTEHPNLQHITSIQRIDRHDHLWMDRFTIRNLELLGSAADSGLTLLGTIGQYRFSHGRAHAQTLARNALAGYRTSINERLDTVEFFIKDVELRNNLSQRIKQCGDVERLVSKIPHEKNQPARSGAGRKRIAANRSHQGNLQFIRSLNICKSWAHCLTPALLSRVRYSARWWKLRRRW